jgi:(1->4)-alpha-D-glucan 1-alpha-D-glucosylmutase
MEKALHEAKVHTSWINPDPDFDSAVRGFVERILDENASGPFLQDFRAFQSRVSHYGLLNSLAQTLLKITAPGVPDTYQGTEVWDFSLVDPDNRRPVDYDRRRKTLGELQASVNPDLRELVRGLVSAKEDGRIKLYITYRAHHCRRDHPGLFSAGDYLPLEGTGAKAEHLFAFARQSGDTVAVVAVPRLLVRLAPDRAQPPLGGAVWQDTRLLLPRVDPALHWHNIFTGERLAATEQQGQLSLAIGDMFAHCPVALLLSENDK